MDSDFQFKNVEKVLKDYAEKAAATYTGLLRNENRVASGNLVNSVRAVVEQDGKAIEACLYLADYWRYLEDGRGVTMKSEGGVLLPKIKEWIRVKGIVPDNRTGEVPDELQLAHMITDKIHREGYRGGEYLKRSMAEVNPQFEKKIEEALMQDVQEGFVYILNTYFN